MEDMLTSKRKRLQQWLSWALITAMMIQCMNPIGTIMAGKSSTDSWEVLYSLDTDNKDGMDIGNEDGDIIVPVQAGETVFFKMQMIADGDEDVNRFKDTFKIDMPEAVYQALVDENGEADEWFESEYTESHYLLELKEPAATPANSRRSTRASGSNASTANADNDVVSLNFQFAEELRKETNPQAVELDAEEYKLSFIAPENMLLVCTPDGYDCVITATALSGMLLADRVSSNKSWDTKWKLLKEENNEFNEVSGTLVKANTLVKLSFTMDIKTTADDSNVRYDDSFEIRIDNKLYELLMELNDELPDEKKQIQWPKAVGNLDSGLVFKDPAGVYDDTTDEMVFYLEFADWYQDGLALANNKHLQHAQFEFMLRTDEEYYIQITNNNNSGSTKISCEKYVKPEQSYYLSKSIIAAFNADGIIPSAEIEKGDYIFYQIRTTVYNRPDGSTFIYPAGDVVDAFNGRLYKFIDISDTGVDDIKTIINGLPNSNTKTDLLRYLALDESHRAWAPADSTELPSYLQKPDYVSWGNRDQIELQYPESTYYFYACLQVQDELTNGYEEEDLNNRALWLQGNKSSSSVPGATVKPKFYDCEITLSPSSRMSLDGSGPVAIRKSDDHQYPNIMNNERAMIKRDDIVTFAIRAEASRNYSDADKNSYVESINIYVPLGFEIMDISEIPTQHRYASYVRSEVQSLTSNPKYYPHISLADSGLEQTAGLQKFTDYPLAQAYDLPYMDFYQVSTYTYTFTEQRYSTDPVIYFTCKVNGIDDILQAAGKESSETNDALAAAFGYLITAEVNNIIDTKTLESVSALDVDSYVDNDPFNDWFNAETGALKRDHEELYRPGRSLYGEDDDRGGHVKDLKGNHFYGVSPDKDEDDFDFAILPPYRAYAVKDNGSITKTISYDSTQVMNALKDVDKNFNLPAGEKYYDKYKGRMINWTGTLYDVDYIVPYKVNINPNGLRDMKAVTLVDQLPEGMRFLTDPDGNPLVLINERVEAERFEAYDEDGNKVYEIREDSSTLKTVKNYAFNQYQSVDGGFPPPDLIDDRENSGNYLWDCKVDEASNSLTIKFGDIGDNWYQVEYLTVVKKVSQSYENQATISWNGHQNSVSHYLKTVDGAAGSREYGKNVSLTPYDPGKPGGGYGKTDQVLVPNADGSVDIYYRIYLDITANQPGNVNYAEGDLVFTDRIDDLFGGQKPSNISIPESDIIIRDGTGAALADPPYQVYVNEAAGSIAIKNIKAIRDTNSCYVDFKVHYHEMPHGITIKNTFVNTTKVKTPLKLDILKVDGVNPATVIKNAGFTLSYDKEGTDLVVDTLGEAIRLITDIDGQSHTWFYPDSSYKAADDTYTLYLKEIRTPAGYYALGGTTRHPEQPYLITIQVTETEDGYQATVVPGEDADREFFEYDVSDKVKGIQLIIKNYVRNTDGSFQVQKELEGNELEMYRFKFYATLEEVLVKSPRNEVTVSFDGGVLTKGGAEKLPAETDNYGFVDFPKLTFSQVGHYIFAIHEEDDGQTGIVYDDSIFYVDVLVTEDPDTRVLKSEASYYRTYENGVLKDPVTDEIPVYKNKFVPAKADLRLKKKLLDASSGAALSLDQLQYDFVLTLSEESNAAAVVMPDHTTVSSELGSGIISFESILFKEAGTYVFLIKEVIPQALPEAPDSMLYDQGTIRATVTVTETDKKLVAGTPVYAKSGDDLFVDQSEADKDAVFINFKRPGTTSGYGEIILAAHKDLIGRTLKNQEFEFKAELIYGPADTQLDEMTVKNNADGEIRFPAFALEQEGIYVFKLSEIEGGESNLTYDKKDYYAYVRIVKNRIGELEQAAFYYGDHYDETTHRVSGTAERPVFVNRLDKTIQIQKVSYSTGAALAGARFKLSYRVDGSSGDWQVLSDSLETVGAEGSVLLDLPGDFTEYEYQLVETKAPSGYNPGRVGIITFTLTTDGLIADWDHSGTRGYVEVSADKKVFIIKNYRSGGGGGGGNSPGDPGTPTPTTPTVPSVPTIPNTPGGNGPGDGGSNTRLSDGDTPLAQLTAFIDNVIPLSGLSKTGDSSVSAVLLIVLMAAGVTGFGVVGYRKKRSSKDK